MQRVCVFATAALAAALDGGLWWWSRSALFGGATKGKGGNTRPRRRGRRRPEAAGSKRAAETTHKRAASPWPLGALRQDCPHPFLPFDAVLFFLPSLRSDTFEATNQKKTYCSSGSIYKIHFSLPYRSPRGDMGRWRPLPSWSSSS